MFDPPLDPVVVRANEKFPSQAQLSAALGSGVRQFLPTREPSMGSSAIEASTLTLVGSEVETFARDEPGNGLPFPLHLAARASVERRAPSTRIRGCFQTETSTLQSLPMVNTRFFEKRLHEHAIWVLCASSQAGRSIRGDAKLHVNKELLSPSLYLEGQKESGRSLKVGRQRSDGYSGTSTPPKTNEHTS